MKERPILFSTPMVRAILEGRKCMTRRVIKNYSEVNDLSGVNWPVVEDEYGDYHDMDCPYGQAGDQLWVRETFEWDVCCEDDEYKSPKYCNYKADGLRPSVDGWRPSIFMPRWASRITLEITNVRVERLQDITEEDAEKEGVDFLRDISDCDETLTAKQLFECLWCSINGDESWDQNPFVWVVEFRRIK